MDAGRADLRQLVTQRALAYPELRRRALARAAMCLERRDDAPRLLFPELVGERRRFRCEPGVRPCASPRVKSWPVPFDDQMPRLDRGFAVGEHERPLQHVLELAHVA